MERERITYVHVLHLGVEVMKLLFENLGNVAGRAVDTSLLHNVVHKTLHNTLHRMQRRRHRCNLVVDFLKRLGCRLWRLGGCTQGLELVVDVVERLYDAELGITDCLGNLRLRGQNKKKNQIVLWCKAVASYETLASPLTADSGVAPSVHSLIFCS